ncbi:hypothetical protein EON63_15340 [archaeon]|nr:MAG: hypothetical protein EON63_15340 [archaeon]
MVHECSGYEDPDCSFQWYSTNVKDHMDYLGLYLSCEAVTNVTSNASSGARRDTSTSYTRLRAGGER